MPAKPIRVVAAGVAVAVSAAVAVPALTTAQAPAGQSFTVQEKHVHVAMYDAKPKSHKDRISLGDRLTTRQSMYDASGHPLGTLYTECSGVGPTKPLFGGAKLLCTTTYALSGGQIVAAGVGSLNAPSPLPIVGGTGAYASVHGFVQTAAKPAKGYDSADLITITG